VQSFYIFFWLFGGLVVWWFGCLVVWLFGGLVVWWFGFSIDTNSL
jgi:hypothetical protein